jgi:alkylation response protein AidB-like acyl-CoA dehydrogenase
VAREAWIARAAARTVFVVFAVFAAVDRVAIAATLHYEVTMQAAAPELRRAATEKGREVAETGCRVATTAPAITEARWGILSRNAPISSRTCPLLPSSREKQRLSDARLGVAGPYCC